MPISCSTDLVCQAVMLLQKGEVVAFPTETVYGLGADASNNRAVQKLFAIKSRPLTKPLSLLIPDISYLYSLTESVPAAAIRLAETFWPGPLTLLLTHTGQVLPSISAHTKRVGLRMPAHPIAQVLLKELGRALAVPSANISGRPSPTLTKHVREQIGEKIPLILEGGECSVGIASTVIDLTEGTPCIHRLGAISIEAIECVLQQTVMLHSMAVYARHGAGVVHPNI